MDREGKCNSNLEFSPAKRVFLVLTYHLTILVVLSWLQCQFVLLKLMVKHSI